MDFLTNLLRGGPGHQVRLTEGGASLKPAGDTDAQLEAFQAVVDRVIRHEGEGYSVHLTHSTSDRPGDLIDVVLIRIGE